MRVNASPRDTTLGCLWLAAFWLGCMAIIVGFWLAAGWILISLLSLL